MENRDEHCAGRRRRGHLVVGTTLGVLASCSVPDARSGGQGEAGLARALDLARGPFREAFEPPTSLETQRVLLEPLGPEHTERDFAALTGSAEHLRDTLRWDGWPPDGFLIEQNREDLVRHREEFDAHEAYAYTVLEPDGETCVGCVYLVPSDAELAEEAGAEPALLCFYWVVSDGLASDLDRHLVDELLAWFEESWPVREAFFPIRIENLRGVSVSRRVGLVEVASKDPAYRVFRWQRERSAG